MKHSAAVWLLAALSVLATPLAAQQGAPDAVHEALERSSWFAGVSGELRRREYHFSPTPGEADVWSAPNRAHDLRSRVSANGLEVVPRSSDAAETRTQWKLVLATKSFGRAEHAVELNPAAVHVTNERIELDHGLLTEWFVNDERGLEQGWTIARAPRGAEPLWIGLEIGGGLYLRIDTGGHSGIFVDATGETRLRYTGLMSFDATGRELDAHLAPSPDGVGIVIDDTDAVYPLTVDPVLSGPAWTAEGDQASANFGWTAATAGDVNGDGYSDVIVGAYLYDNGQMDEGRAFVYLGSGAGLSTSAAWTGESNQTSAWFGASVATAGDVNGDGYSDVIVGAHQYDNGQSDEGRAFVYLGSGAGLAVGAAWTAESDQVGAFFGRAVATAGDVNGDGYSDVIVGASEYGNGQLGEGRAFVYLGSGAGLSTSAAWTAESNQIGANHGQAVAPAGDVNGDGYGDVIVGAFDYDNGQANEGRAFVYMGSSGGLVTSAAWTAESDQSGAFFGASVATAGDVNGDGFGDVIVGAFSYDNDVANEGRAFVYLGSNAGLSTIAAWTAESDQVNAHLGTCVATAGDVNGDGYSDVIVGSSQYDNGQVDEGRAFVYLGSSAGLALSADWTAESDQANAEYGLSVATAGDVNGDGYGDVIVGAYRYENLPTQTDEGRAFVYLGSATGLAASSAWTAESNQLSASLGYSVSTAGDVNGDGYSDVVIGAYLYDNGETDEGRAFVYLGTSAGLSTNAAWTAESDQSSANFGWSAATAGDVNGDGYSDVIVGAHQYDNGETNEGRAFVYLGSGAGLSTSAAWTTESDQASANLGWTVATAGDVNGDGFSDVIVAAYRYDDGEADEGRAFVYLGSSTGLAVSAAWTAESDQVEGWFGYSVSSAGDVNGDGYSDVIVGSQGYDNGQANEGRAFVYLGSRAGLSTSAAWTAESDQDNAQFSYSVATASDVNGDGYSDVIVGAILYDNGQTDEGRAYVYMGSSSGLAASAAWTAESDQVVAGFGLSVASAGDVNGDGYSDVIVGAPTYDNGETNEGRAFVYLGSASGLSTAAAWTVESDQVGARLGFSVATAGDVNGDGYSDVIVGAYLYDAGQPDEGRAFLYLGNQGGGWTLAPQQRQANDTAPIDLFGRSKDRDEFRIKLGFERALTGFAWASGLTPKAHLEWEVRPLRASLDGSHIDSGTEQTITGSPLVFNEFVEFPSAANLSLSFGGPLHVVAGAHAYHWRARVRTTNPLFPVTPWTTIPWNNVTETKLRAGPLERKR